MKQLNEVADLFFSAGIPMPGVQVSQDEALRKRCTNQPSA